MINTIYTHYFLPAIAMLPIAISAISAELEQDTSDEERLTWKKAAVTLFGTTALCTTSALLISSYSIATPASPSFYSKIYNLPPKNVWGLTWPMILTFTAAVVVAITFLQRFKTSPAKLAAWTFAALVAASATFASLPAMQLAPYMGKQPEEYFAPMAVSMAVSALFLVSSFGFRERIPWRKALPVAVPLCILVCYIATPNWTTAFRDLVRRGTHRHQVAAKELEKILPKYAIVIGERSNQMLMSLPIRTASTFAANSNPIPVIESILKSEPNAKLYALVDSRHTDVLKHYRKAADKYRLCPIATFKMPSFSNGMPSDVYLAAIEVLDRRAKQPQDR